MAQKTILSTNQKRFLDLVLKEPYILKNYYWTGGTVLAEFYLNHRESYDIDLFNEKQEVDLGSIEKFIYSVGKKLKASKIDHRRYLGLHSIVLQLPKEELKVDFNYYPFLRINRGKNWYGLEIDSLEDIAVNKVHTLSMKPRTRDFVDLYFILQDKQFILDKLIILAKAKFDWHIDPIQFGHNLAQVVAYKDIPRMLVPFNHKHMEDFFLQLAKSLKKEIFK